MDHFENLIYFNGTLMPDSDIKLSREESRHLKALRKKTGDTDIYLTDGFGTLAKATILSQNSGEAILKITAAEKQSPPKGPEIFLAAAILKGKRYDYLIEKAVELGIAHFIPLKSERVLKAGTERTDRWQKKILAAVKQSKQLFIPEIHPEIHIRELSIRFSDFPWICFHEKSETVLSPQTFKTDSGKIGILIGPEGGFTEEEAGFFQTYRFPDVQRLRAETAAVTAINLIRALYLWKF